MNKFEKLGLSPEVVSVLSNINITEPTEIQEKAIPLALQGHDIIGGSATGSGKTLAFASALLEKITSNEFVQAMVLTPTRELADQVATSIRNFAKNKKLKTIAVYGGVDIQQQIRKIRNADILIGTPGRVLDHLNRQTLKTDKVSFLVLDEVDRMFDMGFQRDVEKIIQQCPTKRQTMLFSATISPDIDYLTKKHTKNAKTVSVQPNVDPKKLKQIFYDVDTNKKFSLLVHLLKEDKDHHTMVFCSTRRNSDFVADNLFKLGIKAKAIHGGLVQNKRTRIINEFQKKEVNVLICTDVAARGLDIKGVSHVYNYDLPRETKDYIHRIGRTARAGKEGIAINILSSRDYESFSDIVNREAVTITKVELPIFPKIMIKRMNTPRGNSFNRGSSFRSQGNRGNSGPRSFGRNNSQGKGSSSSRRTNNSRSFSRNNSGPRRDSSSSGRRFSSRSRDNKPRSFGNNRDSNSRSFGNKPRSFGKDSRKPFNRDNSGPRRDSSSSGRRFSSRSRDDKPRSFNKPRNNSGENERPRRNFKSSDRRTNSKRPFNKSRNDSGKKRTFKRRD